jgi:hypothetical protein
MKWCTGGKQEKTAAKQGMARVDDLDFHTIFFIWVIE